MKTLTKTLMIKRWLLLPVLPAALLLGGCDAMNDASDADRDAAEAAAQAAFEAGQQAWRTTRRERLLEPDGWASLVGLHWIEPGAHRVGSDEDNGIRIAMGPAHLGVLRNDDGAVVFDPADGAVVHLDDAPITGATPLKTDAQPGGPGVLSFDGGKGQATVIERDDRLALRVRHAEAPTRTGFTGLEYWPGGRDWVVDARFVPHPEGRTIEIANIIGSLDDTPNPGVVVFQRDGREYRIEALDEGGDELFLIFADRTSGHGSYSAGRYLYIPRPGADGRVTVDFNHAYNPPCAFTAFATCPLPPPENRLDLAITAGEKAYHGE
ncbi:MAG TPA: DUF1684 domain-containing protein, partial [Xanthomonadaceae bacterium]|nr:DUF1684 domain-containing protein [Xanthomonadaceae bacterium]